MTLAWESRSCLPFDSSSATALPGPRTRLMFHQTGKPPDRHSRQPLHPLAPTPSSTAHL